MSSPFSTGRSRSRVEGVAFLAVLSLLVVLAVVQHRWLGAIAEAERAKLKEEAALKAASIAQEIDRELTRVYLELRIGSKTAEHATPSTTSFEASEFAQQFAKWKADSAHAALVKGVYLAERVPGNPSRLFAFDPASGTFAHAPWPAALLPILEVMDTEPRSQPSGFPLHLRPPFFATPPPVMPEIPALTAPVIDIVVATPPLPRRELQAGAEIRQTVLRHGATPTQILFLDREALQQTLIAAIASSRLPEDGPFEWAVTTAGGEHVAGVAGEASDASSGMMRIRIDELDKSVLRGVLPGLATFITDSTTRFVFQMSSAASSSVSVAGVARGNPGAQPSNGVKQPQSGPWTLKLRHRAGSIDAAVRVQQRRNSLLSLSILVVLGLSAGMVFFSARKLRAVATQQVEFVAAVSHELRTPLAVIRSAADNLADGVVDGREQAQRYGALIRGESVRLSDMVEHVLEFAGADSTARASRGPIDAVEAARVAALAMQGLANERGARVTLDTPDAPLRVNGDISHLTRAVANLIGNALKYGGDAPEVTVRVRGVETGVEISVSDRGVGLESAEIQHLFEPFYRGHRASEAQIPGSGLGLALVKRIVESHGGRVSARNDADGGARFTIALPASPA